MDMEFEKRNRRKKRKREVQLKCRMIGTTVFFLIVLAALVSGKTVKNTDTADASEVMSENVSKGGMEAVLSETAAGTGENTGSDEWSSADETAQTENELIPLKEQLETLTSGTPGTWSIYVKDLKSGATLSTGNQPMYAASLIKLYVMKRCYEEMDALVSNVCLWEGADEYRGREIMDAYLSEMIIASDNESYNEIVRLMSSEHSLPDTVRAANKTGETEDTQHDAAIVYGPVTDYILCVLSSDLEDEGAAVEAIRQISKNVYQYLNGED